MTETTNLGLPIYGANDVPLWTNTNDGFVALDSLVNSCSSVKLNWSTPLHQFTTGNLTYTATKDCWLVGNHGQTAVGTLSINGNIITQANSGMAYFIPPLPLRKGDVVTVQSVESQLYVLEGELVSGNTYVFNEAQVTLDYAHPLHTFSTGNLSYTATKTCWLCGEIDNTNPASSLTINGVDYATGIAVSTYSQKTYISPLKLTKGDVVTVTNSPSPKLHVLDGTVTGSVGALHSNIPDYSNLLYSYTSGDTSYTATQECIAEIGGSPNTTGTSSFSVNGNVVATGYFSSPLFSVINKTIHLQKGDVITWNNVAMDNTGYCNVFGLL